MRQRELPFNSLVLRIIGIITMTLDHIGLLLISYKDFLPNPQTADTVGGIFRIVGRLAFPIFLFLLCEGMRHTHNKPKYILRIGIVFTLILIAQIVLIYAMGQSDMSDLTNPFLDLILVAVMLYCLSLGGPKKILAALPGLILIASFVVTAIEDAGDITILWWPYAFRPAYSLIALLGALGFYYGPAIAVRSYHKLNQEMGISDEIFLETPTGRRNANLISCLLFFCAVLAIWALSYFTGYRIDPLYMSLQSWCLLSIVPLMFYNGRRGPDSKAFRIFNYAYFPVHIVIIYFIFQAIIK